MARVVRETLRRAPLSVLVDTNVVLDLLLDRATWADDASRLLDGIGNDRLRGFIAGHAVTTVHYIMGRARDHTTAATAVSDLLELLDVVSLESADFQRALSLGLRDYEDAVQVAACLKVGATYLVTRNAKDFRGAPVETRSPAEVLALLRP